MSDTTANNAAMTVGPIELPDFTLAELEKLGASVLAQALKRVQQSSTESGSNITAHNSTQHNSSHGSTPW